MLEEIVPLWSLVFHCHLALHLYQAPQVPLEKHDLVPASSEESQSIRTFFPQKVSSQQKTGSEGKQSYSGTNPLVPKPF